MLNKKRRNNVQTSLTVILIILMVLVMVFTVACLVFYRLHRFTIEALTLAVSVFDVLASVVAGAFIVVQLQSDNESDRKRAETEEAKFILEYNSSFIENKELCAIEHYLEDRLTHQGKGDINSLSDHRQSLVNYLVYLEGFASCVQQRMLELKDIDNLFSYRFFLAMNHPEVQELELLPFADFYRGSFQLYDDWYRYRMEKNGKNYISDCHNCDSIMPFASTSLFLYPQFERYLSNPIIVKATHDDIDTHRVIYASYYHDGNMRNYDASHYSKKHGVHEKERIEFVIQKYREYLEDVQGRQLNADDFVTPLQYEQISQLIYETDPYIYPALFGAGPIGIERAKKILPGLFESQLDSMFSKKNLYLFMKGEEVIGIILWIKGDLSWNPRPLQDYSSELGITLVPEDVSAVAQGYVDVRYNGETSSNESISLVNICVRQSLRGIGIGKIMLDEFIMLHHNEHMKLCVLAENNGAINLYKKVGFSNERSSIGFSLNDIKPKCLDMERRVQ